MEQLQLLKNLFSNKDWFYDVGTDSFNRPVVYVKTMSSSIFSDIRNQYQDPNLLIYYSSYAQCNKERYVSVLSNSNSSSSSEEELDMNYLIAETLYLKSLCKKQILQDIFFEVHDKENSVTNFSKDFPEVKSIVEELYNMYGYDLLYEKLEE